MCGASSADHTDGVMIALLKFAPEVEHDRGRMDLAQRSRIRWRLLRNCSRSEIADPLQLRGKIDCRSPARNLIGNFITDAFDLAKLVTFSGEYLLRLLESFEQFAQPHRSDRRQHVERDTCFSRIHVVEALGAASTC